ncbi:MAG TPA: penicillin-binding protein activator [Rhizomicrobium sp.]|jgi:ABC-type branched-subunit amino acid transport system substrate-binding protein|nr:penicillin-binding protein activator [Rhizomicrobium sp.]
MARHPLTGEQSGFARLGNLPTDQTPVRIGVLLPFSNGSASTRLLASSMLKAAEMALYDSGKHNLLLVTADEGAGGSEAAAGVRTLVSEGAEVIIGPLFAQSVSAAAPVARDHGVPLISFSTDRAVAGDGIYLLSFQPENQVQRIISYAASQGHSAFAALVPRTAYGARVTAAFRDSTAAVGAHIVELENFVPEAGDIAGPAAKIAQSKGDAILIAQGGSLLRDIASALGAEGAGSRQVQYLGTGLWDDPATAREPGLAGGWFAAPDPDAERGYETKFRAVFGTRPPPLSALAYDAVSLVALLSSGPPYHRFTWNALTDPSGFSGVDGILRFNPDGTSDRGLAVLKVDVGGTFTVVSPAPRTFQSPGS